MYAMSIDDVTDAAPVKLLNNDAPASIGNAVIEGLTRVAVSRKGRYRLDLGFRLAHVPWRTQPPSASTHNTLDLAYIVTIV